MRLYVMFHMSVDVKEMKRLFCCVCKYVFILFNVNLHV